MIRGIFKIIFSQVFSIDFINNSVSKLGLFKKGLWKGKRFLEDFPWSNKNIHNWIDLFLIFINVKKSSNIVFKNGFIFQNCNKNNWHFFAFYVKKLLEENHIVFENKNEKVRAKIGKYLIIYPELIECIALINEIFVQNDYGRFNFNNKIVLDIGGYIGDSALYFISKGAKKVYVYEINEDSYEILKENIKRNDLEDRIIAINQGIAGDYNEHTLYVTYGKGSSGLYVNKSNPQSIIEYKTIKLIPIKEALKEPIDILKMDCEGCEYDILKNILENDLINKINEGIIFEAHDLDEERNFDYIKSLIEQIGFKNIEFYENKKSKRRAIICSRKNEN